MIILNKIKLVTKSGRNNTGRITVRHRKKGHKKFYKIIDTTRNLHNVPGVVLKILHDSCRTGYVALVYYACGFFSYILCAEGLKPGSIIRSYDLKKSFNVVNVGDALPLSRMPFGSLIYNIEINKGCGGKLLRSAGSFARLIGVKYNSNFKNGVAQILVRNRVKTKRIKRILYINGLCYATMGRVSNIKNNEKIIGKAGKNKWLGIRPSVRGVAMNPIDHPHGGRTAGGRPSVSPWGWLTKGVKTRTLVKRKKYKILVKKVNKNR